MLWPILKGNALTCAQEGGNKSDIILRMVDLIAGRDKGWLGTHILALHKHS